MADYLNKFALTAGTPVKIDAGDSIIGFDFTNDSPFDVDIAWGANQPVALTVPPTTILSGVKPSADLIISGNRRGGVVIATPSFPGGGSPPNAPPAQQLTVHGYVKGNVPPESKTPLNRSINLGNAVIQANQVVQTNQTSGTVVIDAAPSGPASQEVLINNDGSGHMGNITLAGNQRLSWDKFGNLSLVKVLTSAGTQETGKAGGFAQASAGGQTFAFPVNAKTVWPSVPSSITLNPVNSNVNTAGVAAFNIDIYGFFIAWTSGAAGGTDWRGQYMTVGL